MNPPEPAGISALAPELARQILNRDAANLVTRVKEGKTLSAADRKRLASIAAGGTEADPTYAKNITELAGILQVTRNTVSAWKKIPGNPGVRPDGRFEVAAWRSFKATQRAGGRDLEGEAMAEKRRRIELENELLAVKVTKLKERYFEKEVIEQWVTGMILQAKRVLLGLPSALAPQVVGMDVASAEKILRDSINDALAVLHANPADAASGQPEKEEDGQ